MHESWENIYILVCTLVYFIEIEMHTISLSKTHKINKHYLSNRKILYLFINKTNNISKETLTSNEYDKVVTLFAEQPN
jgi:hypothetical protein